MTRLAEAVARLSGWKAHMLALAAGAVSVLAMAPLHLWPVLFITFPVLVWLIDGRCLDEPDIPHDTVRLLRGRARSAALIGWWFGFGYFMAGLYWIGEAFLVEAERFAWLLPVAVSLLPAGLALFFSAGAAVAGLLWRPGPSRLLALTMGLFLAEWLRGHILTGLPWNLLGYALAADDRMMQWASVFGAYGLSLLAVLIFSSPAAIWGPRSSMTEAARGTWGYLVACAVILAGAYVFGEARLDKADPGHVKGVGFRILQPNIPQAEKWRPENRVAIFRKYLQLSQRRQAGTGAGLDGVTHLVWPESAFPFLLARSSEALAAIAELLPEGVSLLTGAARLRDTLDKDGSVLSRDVYNSVYILDDRARILATYDKVHLVPFGEYLPFQSLLESVGLEQLTRVRGGFSFGRGARMMTAPKAPPFAALICYEIIFPHEIRGAGTDPRWILNVTNDAWFGSGTGPYQHLHQARVRAVEQGIPVIRAANTGISAIIDPYGRIEKQLPLNRAGVLDGKLPNAIGATLFVRRGHAVEAGLFLMVLALWLTASRLVRRKPK